MGLWFVWYIGLGMFFVYSGVFFILIYLLLKMFILGIFKELWLKKFMKFNKVGMLSYVMMV